jgi:excisionase family DNA binding protein
VNGPPLKTYEVAERYGVTSETILEWIDKRGLPAYRLTSRAIRYSEAELDAWDAEKATPTEKRQLPDGAANGRLSSVPPATPPERRATTEEGF